MTDCEIAEKLDVVRRTVQYQRASALKELKYRMEGVHDGENNEEKQTDAAE